MNELEQLISASYNACWSSYKKYLKDHDMASYNKRSEEIVNKYGHAEFVENNLFLFAPVVQTMHDNYLNRAGRK